MDEVAAASSRIDASVDLVWFAAAVAGLPAGNRWQARAKAQLGGQLRKLREALLQRVQGENDCAAARGVIEELKRNAPQDLAMLSAGLVEISELLLA